MRLLNLIFEEHFSSFDQIAVIGGLVRDFAREGRIAFRSDVDLVIEAPAIEVADLAVRLQAKPNRFGGYGVSMGSWKIDFWALETTWAARRGGVEISSLEDIIRCTFFDWDAVAYDLRKRRLMCDPTYLDRLRSKALDVNLLATPSVEGNLLRSMRRLMLWSLSPGPQLCRFIEEHLTDASLVSVKEIESRLYSNQVSAYWSDARSACAALIGGQRNEGQLTLALPDSQSDVSHSAIRRGRPPSQNGDAGQESLRLPGF